MTDHSELKRLAERYDIPDDAMGALEVLMNRKLKDDLENLRTNHEHVIALNHQQFGEAIRKNSECDQLKAENEALRKDADRYRWLRENHIFAHVQVEQGDGTQPYVYDSELDRSIDEIMAAMSKDAPSE
jgi:hypothetical protein